MSSSSSESDELTNAEALTGSSSDTGELPYSGLIITFYSSSVFTMIPSLEHDSTLLYTSSDLELMILIVI